MTAKTAVPRPMASCEICILAGGLSTRMGRDKSRLRLGTRTLLGRIRAIAQNVGLNVRVIRHDLVPRCGPLGGIYTALKTTQFDSVLFLACDMPFITSDLLLDLLIKFSRNPSAIFSQESGSAGFPFILPSSALGVAEKQLAQKSFSLQKLAGACRARKFVPRAPKKQLFNLNTPADWKAAKELAAEAPGRIRRK